MTYNLKGTDVSITDELREYVEKKCGHAAKFLYDQGAARIDVELAYLATEEKQYCAELMLHDKKVLRAEAMGSSLYEAIDTASSELIRMLSGDKKKRLHTLRHSAVKVKEYLRGWRSKI